MWVLLLSVLGSAIFTIRILVDRVKTPVKFNCLNDVRDRVHQVVEHQYIMLFSPVGAVFFYQILVAAGAASNQVTVAFVALASGIGLPIILERAIKTLTAWSNQGNGTKSADDTVLGISRSSFVC